MFADWGYTVGHETGTNTDPQAATTNSGPGYQQSLSTLSTFMASLDLAEMRPSTAFFSVAGGGSGMYAFGLAGKKEFAAYIVDASGASLTLKLPGGWMDAAACVATVVEPQTGAVISTHQVGGGVVKLPAAGDVALMVRC